MKSKVTVPVMKDPLPQRQKNRKHTCLVGWIHAGKQIKTPRGGGTRKLNLPKSCKKGEILEEVKPLFSPEGKSPMGPIEDFDFSVADFSEHIGTKDSGGVFWDAMSEFWKCFLHKAYQRSRCKDSHDSSHY